MTELVRGTEALGLPRGKGAVDALLRFVNIATQLPNMVSLAVTARHVTVERWIVEGDAVIPAECGALLTQGDDIADAEFLLSRIEIVHLDRGEARHPLLAFANAIQELERCGLKPCAILAPDDDTFDHYVGNPEDTLPQRYLGLPVSYDRAIEAGNFLVLGSVTGLRLEPVRGIIIAVDDEEKET